MPTLRFAAAQMHNRGTLQGNLDQTLRMIGEVRDLGGDVAVFGENNIVDSVGRATADDFATAVRLIRDRAKACGIHVVVGVTSDTHGLKQALVVDRQGNTLCDYHKSSEVPQRFDLDSAPCAVSICADRWYLEHADLACLTQRACVLIDISGGHGGDDGRPNLRWVRYRPWAVRNSSFVVVCNLPHHDAPDYMGNAIYGGHSAIVDPTGRLLARAGYEYDTIIYADIDIGLATRENAERRRNHPLFKAWWDLGKSVLEGGEADEAPYEPLPSPEAETVLAAAQVTCSGHVDTDVATICNAIASAARQGARVVAFPERALDSDDPYAVAEALQAVHASARDNGIYVILGMRFHEGADRRNSAVVIDASGAVVTRYDQIAAQAPFTPGHSAQAMWFDIDGVPATVTIGDDLLWPELTELAAYSGMHLHFHLDNRSGATDDDNHLRKMAAICHCKPSVCALYVNAAVPTGSSGTMLLKRIGGHDKPIPPGVEAYLPYHISVVRTAGDDPEVLLLTAKTGALNLWEDDWCNKGRRTLRGHSNWWHWIQQGVHAVHADLQVPA